MLRESFMWHFNLPSLPCYHELIPRFQTAAPRSQDQGAAVAMSCHLDRSAEGSGPLKNWMMPEEFRSSLPSDKFHAWWPLSQFILIACLAAEKKRSDAKKLSPFPAFRGQKLQSSFHSRSGLCSWTKLRGAKVAPKLSECEAWLKHVKTLLRKET
jgi:hypothetical protein